MGLERIISRIKDDAKSKADKILADARAQAQDIIDNANAEADKLSADIATQATEQAKQEHDRIVTLARLEERKILLKARQQVVSEAFDQALSELSQMPDDQYLQLLADIIVSAARGDEQIIVNDRDRSRITQQFIDRLNSDLKATDKPGQLKLSDQSRPISGGAVLVCDRIETNLSFDAALSQIRDDLAIEVAQLLAGSKEVGS